MDIDALDKQVRSLMAFKAWAEPILLAMAKTPDEDAAAEVAPSSLTDGYPKMDFAPVGAGGLSPISDDAQNALESSEAPATEPEANAPAEATEQPEPPAV